MKTILCALFFEVASLSQLSGQIDQSATSTEEKTGKELLAELSAFKEKHERNKELHFIDQEKIKMVFVSKYSFEEISTIFRKHDYVVEHLNFYFDDQLYFRWGFLDGKEAIAEVRGWEFSAAIHSGIHGSPSASAEEYLEMDLAATYREILNGWASKSPKEVWVELRDKSLLKMKSKTFDDYHYWYWPLVFENLAAVDPDYAFHEILQSPFSKRNKREMFRGFFSGAPKGVDWEKKIEQINALDPEYYGDLIERMANARWMEDSPRQALKRYQSAAPGRAVGYWMTREPKEAFSWLIKYGEIWNGAIAEDILRGIESRRGGQHESRKFLRIEISRLKQQAIRELFTLAFQNQIFSSWSGELRMKIDDEFLEQLKSLNLSPEIEKKVTATIQKRAWKVPRSSDR